MSRRAIVIGGGIGGLTAAWRLQQRGWTVTILEAGDRWGGVTQTRRTPGMTLELGPDSLIRTKPAGLQLLKDLGLDGGIIGTGADARSSMIARGRRLLRVPDGLYLLAPGRIWPFVWSSIISWPGKFVMLKDLWARTGNGADESLASFVRRRLGREALERLAQPMVSGIYTADPERLSLAATMPQFLEMERTHGSLLKGMRARAKAEASHANASGPRYGLFMSVPGGLASITEALVERLRAGGADLRLNTPATSATPIAGGWQVDGLTADAVVCAQPAWAAAAVLEDADPNLATRLAEIAYASVATINFVFAKHQVAEPKAAGFVVPAIEGRVLLACTCATRKWPGRAPEDTVILRAFVGGALHGHHLERDDASLTAAVLADLRELLPIHGEPTEVVISRWPQAMAQYEVGHLERVAGIRQRERALPGLALVGNGYEGVGIPDVVAQADAAAARLS